MGGVEAKRVEEGLRAGIRAGSFAAVVGTNQGALRVLSSSVEGCLILPVVAFELILSPPP